MHPRFWSRRTARAAALTTCGLAAAAALAAGTGVPAGASPSTLTSVVAATRKAILSSSAVRVTSTARSTTTHKVTETAVFDAGRRWSRQHYATGTAHVDILLTPTHAFFSGNKSGLTTMFAMPSSDVAKVGTKWVDITSSEAQYKDFSSAVLSSLPRDFLPGAGAKHLRLTTTGKGKAALHVLTWSTSANKVTNTYRLEVAAAGRALPVREIEVQGAVRQVTTFGHWNEHLVVRAPRHTIAYTALVGG